MRGDVPAAGGLGDAVHHAPGVESGQRVASSVVQERPYRPANDDDADGAHHGHWEWDVGGLAALADELRLSYPPSWLSASTPQAAHLGDAQAGQAH